MSLCSGGCWIRPSAAMSSIHPQQPQRKVPPPLPPRDPPSSRPAAVAPTTTTAPTSTTAAPTAATAAGTAGRRKAYAVGARKISETIAPGSGFASQLSVVGGDPDETSTTIALGNEMYTIGELFPFLPALPPIRRRTTPAPLPTGPLSHTLEEIFVLFFFCMQRRG